MFLSFQAVNCSANILSAKLACESKSKRRVNSRASLMSTTATSRTSFESAVALTVASSDQEFQSECAYATATKRLSSAEA